MQDASEALESKSDLFEPNGEGALARCVMDHPAQTIIAPCYGRAAIQYGPDMFSFRYSELGPDADLHQCEDKHTPRFTANVDTGSEQG